MLYGILILCCAFVLSIAFLGAQSDLLRSVGFVDVLIKKKVKSKEYIKDWMPGAGAEDYIVSADVTALKPGHIQPQTNDGGFATKDDCCAPTTNQSS